MNKASNIQCGKGSAAWRPGLWRAMAGFIVWAVAFVFLYAGHAIGCLYAPVSVQPLTIRNLLIVLWVVHILFLAALLWTSCRRRNAHLVSSARQKEESVRFMWRVVSLLDVLALVSVLITGLPLLLVPPCAA